MLLLGFFQEFLPKISLNRACLTMPSGQTHDSITLWSLPLVAGLTFERTRSTSLTLMISGSFLFSGLMFGPDLDTYSRQFKRWGILRWIWLPYRRSMRHRSFLSHGPIVGTIVRVIYLFSWVAAAVGVIALVSAIAYGAAGEIAQWTQWAQQYWTLGLEVSGRSLLQYGPELFALMIGLELGAMSHSLSDWIGSWHKRQFRQGQKSIPLRRRTSRSTQPKSSQPPPSPTSPASFRVELPVLPPPKQQDSQMGNRE
ncbi:MAG: hypothetical protein OHK0047_02410 [Leptolyngbyaceae cyanobacterium]